MAQYSVDYDGDLSTTDDRVSYGSFDDAVGSINSQGFDSYSIQDNRRGGGGGLGSFGSDRGGREAGFAALNAARPVRSGLGGLLGGLFGGGRQGGGIFGYTGLRDMVDGAGPGASGPQFRGGLYSGLLNAVGVSPLGQGRRAQMAASPDVTFQGTRPLPAGAAPAAGAASTAGGATAGGAAPSTRSFVPIPQAGPVRFDTRPLTASDVVRLQIAGHDFDAQVGLPATPEEIMFLDARVPSATDRFMGDYGMTPGQMSAMTPAASMPTASMPAAAPNPALLPRATPDMGELRNYITGQPNAMTSVSQPGMNVMPDGEAFLRQNIAVLPAISSPMVSTPQTDPRVGGRYAGVRRPMPQIEGFSPFSTGTTPAPTPNAMSISAADRYLPPDQFRANQLRAYNDMQARAAGGLLGR